MADYYYYYRKKFIYDCAAGGNKFSFFGPPAELLLDGLFLA
jgi:hypothetical protein